MSETIFTVTTLHLHDKAYGASPRTVGWYPDLLQAVDCVQENRGDIFETVYTYAVIEELPWGLYPKPTAQHWFEWSNDLGGGYRPIAQAPEDFAEAISCGTIG